MDLRIVVIAGAASNTGKTTLLCELLRELSRDEPWEAIKLTRGHHRSCGKDPHACCVGDLLSDHPMIRSGRESTWVFGKDTGRYWDAGAANVHWVIATDDQVEAGIREALHKVRSRCVLVEGTSLLKYFTASFAVLAVRADKTQIKPSARIALSKGQIDVVYSRDEPGSDVAQGAITGLPLYREKDLPRLVDAIRSSVMSWQETKPGAIATG
ncbi:MAG: hypothetical protein IPM55_13280 [Acidobacteria bacterium]|nr:hypothetical protein [Acidobacteriota bacterium]